MADNKLIGKAGENLATELLRSKGYNIICRNYLCSFGEIDIVAQKYQTLCFVEVKTRTSNQYGSPSEAVDSKKLRHIRNTAKHFLSGYKGEYRNVDFQVIEVETNHMTSLDL